MRCLLLLVALVMVGQGDAQVGSAAVKGGFGAMAVAKMPVIRAGSGKVSIRDGDFFDRDAWNLSPGARPDVYTADRTRKTKWVTFYTDMDSIRVKVKPGGWYDFVILWNGKDSCFTRIVSAIPPGGMDRDGVGGNGAGKGKTDTIPYKLTEYNSIAAQAVINDSDSAHDMDGRFGWDLFEESGGL
ncbi:MAG: hypothetical protein JST42_07975 [Bacteroidetes bacterium]|nr:hypothetical protein [Bacteroidota bacterium]